MRLALLGLLAGEVLALVGLWLIWPPLAFLAAGGQLIAYGLLKEAGERK